MGIKDWPLHTFVCLFVAVTYALGLFLGGKVNQEKIETLEKRLEACQKMPLDTCTLPHNSPEHHRMLSKSLAKWRLTSALKTDSAFKAQGWVGGDYFHE